MNTLELQIKWFGVIIAKNSDRPLQANDMHKRFLTAMYNSKIDEAKKLMEEHIEEIKLYTVADYSCFFCFCCTDLMPNECYLKAKIIRNFRNYY
jgi:hypothetical protein